MVLEEGMDVLEKLFTIASLARSIRTVLDRERA